MTFSVVPAVRADLVGRFTRYLSLAGDPDVLYGDPGRHIPDRFVAVGPPIGDTEREIRRLPHDQASSVDETFTLQIIVWSLVRNRFEPDAQQQAVEDAYAVAERLDQGMRASQAEWTLDGLVTWALLGEASTVDDYTLTEGRAAQLLLSLRVKAARI